MIFLPMKGPTTATYIGELGGHLSDLANRFKACRWYVPAFWIGVLQDIAADIRSAFGVQMEKIRGKAKADEACDREALRLKELAQKAESPGGKNITPDEAVAIFRHVERSAELAHDAGDLAQP